MKINKAASLQAAAIIVAAPRYMGAFAAAIGIDVVAQYSWFADIEIWSGGAMAILEGLAIAFVFGKWRNMTRVNRNWWTLLALQIALMLALPLSTAPYLMSSQLGAPVYELMPRFLLWLWSLLVAGIAPLVLAAVGYADRERGTSQHRAKREPAQSRTAIFKCNYCGASEGKSGKPIRTQAALNAHKAHCPMKVSGNGAEGKKQPRLAT
jgi:hypothetical protein